MFKMRVNVLFCKCAVNTNKACTMVSSFPTEFNSCFQPSFNISKFQVY